jgi:hypothetical protein
MSSTNRVCHYYLREVHIHTPATLIGEILNVFIESSRGAITRRKKKAYFRTWRTVLLFAILIGFIPNL